MAARGPNPTEPARGTPPRGSGDGPRTRGGWTPVGTAADRRAKHAEHGTVRGERTRRRIIDAAERVFERDDYLTVGVEDIVKEAGVSRGSFYTYFPSKLEVFRVVAAEVTERVDASLVGRPESDRGLDHVEALCRANARYVDAYGRNARIYASIEQLGRVDEELQAAWRGRRQHHIERVANVIRRWQARGLADSSVDPVPTAAAFNSMAANLCSWLFVSGADGYDVDDAVEAMNLVWIRTLGLRRP
jgi:AcrR family transcriptional regulator